MTRRAYPTDLTDAQWEQIAPYLPTYTRGRRRTYALREIFNALLYIDRTGCQWRMLPHDFPPHASVFDLFTKWKRAGVFDRLHDVLVLKLRVASGREPEPSVGVVDSQSVKINQKGGIPYQKGGPPPPLAATNTSKLTEESATFW
jgi:putative transposase